MHKGVENLTEVNQDVTLSVVLPFILYSVPFTTKISSTCFKVARVHFFDKEISYLTVLRTKTKERKAFKVIP